MRRKSSFLILLFTISIIFIINISHAADVCTSEDYCPPYNDPECVLGCGGSISSEQATNQDYYNISITEQKHVIITMTPAALTNYDLYTMWLNETCPTTSYNNCSLGAGPGVTETCDEDLLPGIYPAMVKKQSGTTYSLSVSCENIRCYSDCSPNPPVDGCSIKCGQTISGLSSSNIQTFKFNIPSRKYVTITMTPAALTNYDLYTRWIPEFCPYDDGQGVGWDCKPQLAGTETCSNQSLSIGTYFIKVKKQSGTTYSLSLSCYKVPNGYPCNTGDDCQSNVCINGICGSCTKDSEQCSIDAQNGLCVLNSSGYNFTYNGWNFLVGDRETQPSDIAFNGTHFWIIGHNKKNVIRYDSNGNFQATEFYVGGQENNSEGIEFNGTHFWIVGYIQDTIYRYNRTGNWDNSWSCSVSSQETHPNAVTYNGSHFWVTGSDTDTVYRYLETSTGCTYQGIEFTLSEVGETAPDGLTLYDNHFYVEGIIKKRVFRYTNGNYDYWNFSLSPPSSLPYGIDFDKLYFYVVDYTSADNNDKVYRFDPPKDCDPDEVCFDGSNYTADCSQCSLGKQCDPDVNGNFVAEGLCAWDEGDYSNDNYDCDLNVICDDTGSGGYRTDCSLCDNLDKCDDVSDLSFNPGIKKCWNGNCLSIPDYCDIAIQSSELPGYSIDQNNKYYCLIEDSASGLSSTAITFASGKQNTTLDCLGHRLGGNDAPSIYGVDLQGINTKNNTIKNCRITDFFFGIRLYNGPNNNTLVNNTASSNSEGLTLSTNANNNTLVNNTANSNSNMGIHLVSSSDNTLVNNRVFDNWSSGYSLYQSFNNKITGGSSHNNYYDYWFSSTGPLNNFTNTNFTDSRTIEFWSESSGPIWFNYNNDTTNNLWLKTKVSSTPTIITRKLIFWTQSLMKWNDTVDTTKTVRYNITGLKININYNAYDNNNLISGSPFNSGSAGEISFTVNLPQNEQHEIKVEEFTGNYLTVESTILSYWDQGTWIESVNVPPIAGGNRQMNVTVIVKNSTIINTCWIRIFNSSGSYSNPTIGPLSGTFRIVGSQVQCYRLWDMEYWRNSGPWNVSVSLSDTVSNFTSKNFTYASLVSLDINVTNINFGTGYPGDRVNSNNSYPLGINNTGNTVLNVYINGSDFVGQTDANYKIRVNNITYSKDKSVFTQLTITPQLVFSNLNPKEIKPLYFNMSIPIGYLNQNYQNNININATG